MSAQVLVVACAPRCGNTIEYTGKHQDVGIEGCLEHCEMAGWTVADNAHDTMTFDHGASRTTITVRAVCPGCTRAILDGMEQ